MAAWWMAWSVSRGKVAPRTTSARAMPAPAAREAPRCPRFCALNAARNDDLASTSAGHDPDLQRAPGEGPRIGTGTGARIADTLGLMMAGRRITELLAIELPIVQAPMANAQDHELAAAVADAGGLGSLPCASLTAEGIRKEVHAFRSRTARPLNLNFFCHTPPLPDPVREARWRELLRPFYDELALPMPTESSASARTPFDETSRALVEELRPDVVSFHFGLPGDALLARVRKTGAKIIASATTVAEARWLEERGCDAIIAQGAEAGGHRGTFLSDDPASGVGTFALVPQIVDAVDVPVIAAGGIMDARGVIAAFALGASGVQLGTAYLRCPEARITPLHRAALAVSRDDSTRVTNLFTGRPARGLETRFVRAIGPVNDAAPTFPLAAAIVGPLRARAEANGSADFSPMWAGQGSPLGRDVGAADLTRALAREADMMLRRMSA